MGNSISGVRREVPSNASEDINTKFCINKLPRDLQGKVFSYLRPSELSAVCLTDKIRNQIINTSDLKRESIYWDFAFNSKDWKKICKKNVHTEGERTSLPLDIWKKLNSPCPAFPPTIWDRLNNPCKAVSKKRIGQTHMLVWIPKKIGKWPLTLNSFGCGYIRENVVTERGKEGIAKSYWILMTKDVLPGSRDRSYTDQERLVANLDTASPYEVPRALEAVSCISTNYFKSGKRQFSSRPLTYTNCQEQWVVGSFTTDGLKIVYAGDYNVSSDYKADCLGVAALKKFS